MNNMERRRLLLLLPALPTLLRAQDLVVRGKLSLGLDEAFDLFELGATALTPAISAFQ